MTARKPGPDPVHFTMLENGLDFIWSAVEHLSVATSKRELKYALLHLVSGIELILKERLRREDWRLLFPKPENADAAVYKVGTFKSVDFVQLIDRVGSRATATTATGRQANPFKACGASETASSTSRSRNLLRRSSLRPRRRWASCSTSFASNSAARMTS